MSNKLINKKKNTGGNVEKNIRPLSLLDVDTRASASTKRSSRLRVAEGLPGLLGRLNYQQVSSSRIQGQSADLFSSELSVDWLHCIYKLWSFVQSIVNGRSDSLLTDHDWILSSFEKSRITGYVVVFRIIDIGLSQAIPSTYPHPSPRGNGDFSYAAVFLSLEYYLILLVFFHKFIVFFSIQWRQFKSFISICDTYV